MGEERFHPAGARAHRLTDQKCWRKEKTLMYMSSVKSSTFNAVRIAGYRYSAASAEHDCVRRSWRSGIVQVRLWT